MIRAPAAVVGVRVARVRLLSFALGAGCAGAAGTLMGLAFSFTPSSGATYLLDSFAAVVILGGLGNVLGTWVAEHRARHSASDRWPHAGRWVP